jgi:hypothetical protein
MLAIPTNWQNTILELRRLAETYEVSHIFPEMIITAWLRLCCRFCHFTLNQTERLDSAIWQQAASPSLSPHTAGQRLRRYYFLIGGLADAAEAADVYINRHQPGSRSLLDLSLRLHPATGGSCGGLYIHLEEHRGQMLII